MEKPLAADSDAAARLAEYVADAGVATQWALTWRYSPTIRAFLHECRDTGVTAARAWFLSGVAVKGPFATRWRREAGPVTDVGSHVLDALDAAVGPVTAILDARADDGEVVVRLRHAGGTETTAHLSITSPTSRAGIEVLSRSVWTAVDCRAAVGPLAFRQMQAEFADVVRTSTPLLDARHGARLQGVVDEVRARLA